MTKASAILGVLLISLWLPAVSTSAERAQVTAVLVELFTSEGCSSCPPADALLRELQSSQPVEGALIVPIGFHVDYWNYIGWTDRFSSPEFSRRQESYNRRLRQGPYTPQIVVDGSSELVGSDRRALFQAVTEAARQPKPLRVQLTRQKDKLRVLVEGSDVGPADVFLTVVENSAETQVLRGENGGKTLRHAAVARNLQIIAHQISKKWEADVALPLPSAAEPKNLRAIVFVQSRGSGRVLGLAAIPF